MREKNSCGFCKTSDWSCRSCLSARLGASEQRTEPYMKYGEGAAQHATTYSAKSDGKVGGFAGNYVIAAGTAG